MNKPINTRCVVTGLGMINAIGNSVDECWDNALIGKEGIDVVKSVNADECYANLGAEVDCDELDKYEGVDRASKLFTNDALCTRNDGGKQVDAHLLTAEEIPWRCS